MKRLFEGKRVLITGGTGSLGKVLVRRILSGEVGDPEKVIILSRDEAKQHFMRLEYQHKANATDEVIYCNFKRKLVFRIGDVRDYSTVVNSLRGIDYVINAAAMKQLPTCEYFPREAVMTNVLGAENIVRAIEEHDFHVDTVVGVSTDKACKPVCVMGMTKAIQERIIVQGNMRCPGTRFICTRYGNVLASRGSVIPLFHEQINLGGPVTITTREMTRFLLSLNNAVDLIFDALLGAGRGETWIPKLPSSLIVNVARALIQDRNIAIVFTGIRPGEKVHEIMISDEEARRTVDKGKYYAILPILPELADLENITPARNCSYSSEHNVMTLEQTKVILRKNDLMIEDIASYKDEILR